MQVLSDHPSSPGSPLESGPSGFGDRVRSAVFWRSGSQIVAQIVTWSSTLIVIRVLEPGDYGLFAMSQVVLAFLSFLNGYGFASALIQSETLNPFRIRQAFGILLLLNAGLAAVQLAAAPLVADYYNQPVIADMLRVQALIFLATPFIALPEVLMGRRLDFRRQAYINLTAAIIGATTALVLASRGFGVWTLVYAPIAMFWTRAIGLTWVGRTLVWPSFDFRGCGRIIAFGSAILASQLFWLVQTQSDVFFAGRQFDPHHVGLYAEALFLAHIFVSKFVPPLNEVAFPAYARIQSDAAAIRWSFLKAARLVMLLALPVYAGMAVTAGPLVATLFGPKWLELTPIVTILALAMPFMTLQILFAPVLNALGHPSIPLKSAIAGAMLFGCAFFIGSRWGIWEMAAGWLVAAPLLMIVTIRLAQPHLAIGLRDLAATLAPIGAAAATMALAVAGVDRWLAGALDGWPVAHLAVLVLVGAPVYLAALALMARGHLREALALVFRRKAAVQA